jgi:ABC-2 type transport system permease protein
MALLSDTWLIFRRYLKLTLREPVWVATGLSQPVVFLLFYGPIMTHTIQGPGMSATQAWQIYVPGVLLQLGLFGAAFVGFSIIGEWRSGVVDRMRVTPASRLALLLGRVLRDAVVLIAQSVLLLAVAFAFGLRTTVGGVLIGLCFVALLAVALASLSYALGLLLKSEMALTPMLNSFTLPFLLLSGVLLPMSFAPTWLNTVSRVTPFRYVVEAMRDAFVGHFTSAALVQGAAVALVLGVASLWLAARTFARQSA